MVQVAATYFTGKPCKHGHVADRYLASRHCVECSRQYKRENRHKFVEYQRKWNGYPEPTRTMPDACECCGKADDKSLHLDHCHDTGEFRGWLCQRCNHGIGLLGDDIEGVKNAMRYLEEWFT